MNKNLPLILLALAAVTIGLVVSGIFNKPSLVTQTSLEVIPRILEGSVAYPQQTQPVRLAAIVGGIVVASSKLTKNKYHLELPAKIPSEVAFSKLDNIGLVHGEGHLKGTEDVKAADVKLIFYEDTNNNTAFDRGEPQLEGMLFQSKTDPALQAYFKHKLILLNGAAKLQENMDTASGAKGYYKYNLDLQPGWVLLEGELVGGYTVKAVTGSNWDVVLPLLKGGNTGPATFAPN